MAERRCDKFDWSITHHDCNDVLCIMSTGVSTESQNRTSVLHLRQDFLATRNMTRIDVGLARSYVKLLLSSWKTYMCNLMAWYINK